MSKREWVDIAITGIIGGVVAGVLTLGVRIGANPDNYLAFLGGVVGAGLAVIGARWLEERKVAAERRNNNAVLKRAIEGIKYRAEMLANIEPNTVRGTTLTVEQTIGTYEKIRSRVEPLDPEDIAVFDTVSYWMPHQIAQLQAIRVAALQDGADFDQIRRRARQVAAELDEGMNVLLRLQTMWGSDAMPPAKPATAP